MNNAIVKRNNSFTTLNFFALFKLCVVVEMQEVSENKRCDDDAQS